ncbi:MAG: hypothetical protein ACXWZS_09060 [Gemmatirosa sp.]
MPHTQDDTPTGLPSGASGAGGGDPADVQALADRVYRLLVAEVRLERARGFRAPARR